MVSEACTYEKSVCGIQQSGNSLEYARQLEFVGHRGVLARVSDSQSGNGRGIEHEVFVQHPVEAVTAQYAVGLVMKPIVFQRIWIIALSALLHDVDDHKLFASENNANARHFLGTQRLEQEKIEQICCVINSVSYSKNRGKSPKSMEGKIVQDADRLDAIGAIGIARTFAFGGKCGRSIERSLQHFHEKLLFIKNEMNTDEAKHIAESRHAFMETFLEEINKEMKTCNDIERLE